MHYHIDRVTHTMTYVTPDVEHWLEQEITQWVHTSHGDLMTYSTHFCFHAQNRYPFYKGLFHCNLHMEFIITNFIQMQNKYQAKNKDVLLYNIVRTPFYHRSPFFLMWTELLAYAKTCTHFRHVLQHIVLNAHFKQNYQTRPDPTRPDLT